MARKKTGLGKGLDAILPESLAEELELGEKTFAEIPLDNITPNPLQPRLEFNEESLAELAESIKAQGVLQPIIVVPNPEGGFMLIAGERRWRAAKLAGLSEIPAIILKRELSKEELLFVSLVENLQREDLDPVEEAQAYKALMEKFNLTQDEIAKRVGKSRPAIANALRILKLPEQILKLLKERKITAGHARVLLEEKDPMRQIRLAKLAASRGLSVERLSIIVMGKAQKRKRAKKPKDPELAALEDELSIALGTRTEIVRKRRGGKLIIHFTDEEQLSELIGKLVTAEEEKE